MIPALLNRFYWFFLRRIYQINFELSDLNSVYLVSEWRRERLLARIELVISQRFE